MIVQHFAAKFVRHQFRFWKETRAINMVRMADGIHQVPNPLGTDPVDKFADLLGFRRVGQGID
jgi:hypothetical protein